MNLKNVAQSNPAWAARIRKELEPVKLTPGTEHLMRLFEVLDDKRDHYVITGMEGTLLIPRAISSLELEAHCRRYGIHLTAWENETIDAMDRAFREESAKLRGSK